MYALFGLALTLVRTEVAYRYCYIRAIGEQALTVIYLYQAEQFQPPRGQ